MANLPQKLDITVRMGKDTHPPVQSPTGAAAAPECSSSGPDLNPHPVVLTEAQEHAVEVQVDNAMEIADQMLDTREDIDDLLRDAEWGARVIDYVIDPIAGMIPVVGDGVAAACGIYIIQKARKAGVPKEKIRRMFFNIIADFGIGLVPGVGDVADLFFRANHRNVEIFRQYVKHQKMDKYLPKF